MNPGGSDNGTGIGGFNGTQQPGGATTPGEKKGLGVVGIILIVLLSLVVLFCGAVAAFWFMIRPKLTEDSAPWFLTVSRLLDSGKEKVETLLKKFGKTES